MIQRLPALTAGACCIFHGVPYGKDPGSTSLFLLKCVQQHASKLSGTWQAAVAVSASGYISVRAATRTSGYEPFLKLRIGGTTFRVLQRTDSSASLLLDTTMRTAMAEEDQSYRSSFTFSIAAGWFQTPRFCEVLRALGREII